MIRDRVSISMDTYKAVLDSENLGEPHSTLLGGDMWYPPDEQQVREVLARKELTGSGLMDGTRIGDDFLETLTVMQRATVEYYTFAGIERRSITVRTAAMGRDAVLVVSGGGIIELEPIPVDRMAQCLVEALPDAPAARVHSMACDETDLKGILNDKWLPSSNSVRDAKRMKRWLEAERINAGQLYAAVRDGSGSRNATSVPVPTWIDTEEGRILFSVDGNGWVNLVGAGPAAIADKLRALEQSLRN